MSSRNNFDIVVASNGSLNIYPGNTLTSFSNQLPFPISPKGGHHLFVRPRRLFLSKHMKNEFLSEEDHVGVIQMSELEGQGCNSIVLPILARFNLKKLLAEQESESTQYVIAEFLHSPWLPLRDNPITHLSVSLKNTFNDPLSIGDGPATLLQVEVASMIGDNSFSVTCLSHSPYESQLFPDNEPTRFRSKLPREMQLGEWEVALSSFALPPGNVYKRNASVTLQFWGSGVSNTVTLDLDYIGERRSFYDTMMHVNHLMERSGRGFGDFLVKNDSGRWLLKNYTKHAFIVKVNSLFNAMFGEPFDQEWTLHPDESAFLHSPEVTPDVERASLPGIALMYCSIVEPSAVGSQLVPLLHIVPMHKLTISDDEGREAMYEPRHLTFYPVKRQAFSDIEISLNTAAGAAYPLNYHKKNPNDPNTFSNTVSKWLFATGGATVTLIFRPRAE